MEKVGEVRQVIELMNKEIRYKIFETLSDCWSDLFYYDRKEDPELTVGDIQNAIQCGDITIDEMVEHFRNQIKIEVGE